MTPKVLQFIGPFNDSRRHGRGNLLVYVEWQATVSYRQSG
jgi:hypothetical protein